MLKLINKDDYINNVGSIPNNFDNLAIQASAYVNQQTLGRIDINNISDSVKYATCLICQIINEENMLFEKSNLKSQNIEGWSETYSTPEEIKKSFSDKKKTVLKTYLFNEIGIDGNPLLYCGVC